MPAQERTGLPGLGLVKGLGVTFKHLIRPAVTQQYPHEKPDLPPRTRGVIALKEANCTVCYKCSRACPDWCIYIDAHKETHEPAGGGKARSAKILDRFAIDFALCMYCGICVEVCPFDALFWSPEYEYAEFDLRELLHEKDRLEGWMSTVLPPLDIEEGAEVPDAAPPAPAAPAAPAAGAAGAEGAAVPPGESLEPGSTTTPAPEAPKVEVEPDQAVYDETLAAELAKGTPERVAIGKAKRAAMLAAKKAASGGGAAGAAVPPGESLEPGSTTAPAPAAPKVEVEPDQVVYDETLAAELAKGTPERVAIGKAKRAAMLAARKKAGG